MENDKKLNNFIKTTLREFLNENLNEFNTYKSGDIVKFVDKKDKNNIINGEIMKVDKEERRIYFKNIDYPETGIQNMSEYSISTYWDIVKVS